MADPVSVGVDWGSGVWIVAAASAEGVDVRASPSFLNVVKEYESADVILVDTPILLNQDLGQRECDREAQNQLGGARRSSVFNVPCKAAVESTCYKKARDANGGTLGCQSWSLSFQIREVRTVLDEIEADPAVYESHPEVCFNGFENSSVVNSKKDEAGREDRIRAVEKTGSGAKKFNEEYDRVKQRANERTAWQHRIGRGRLDDAVDALGMARAGELALEGEGFDCLPVSASVDGETPTIAYYEI